MSGNVNKETLSLPSLGRPFRLGMLYDCRKHEIVPSVPLWDKNILDNIDIKSHRSNEYHIIASDSFGEKASALKINGGMKLSILGGFLGDISGSGKYISNQKSSNKQERVTLQYKCTTKFEQLRMENLRNGRVQSLDVINHGTATHVVTGITYGAQAFFVFESDKSSSSTKNAMSGSLQAMVKKITQLKLDVSGEVKAKKSRKESTYIDNFRCTYIGDYLFEDNPSTYEEVVQIYKGLSKHIIDNEEIAVPLIVYLYPLEKLDSRACQLVREISNHLVRKTETVLDDLYELEVRCNDIIKSDVIQNYCRIENKILKFKSLLIDYRLKFQNELSQLIVPIIEGKEEESKVADLLRGKESSPFNQDALATWIETINDQVNTLSQYLSYFSPIKFASKSDLRNLIRSPNYTHILCFTILMPTPTLHLTKMDKYLKNDESESEIHVTEEVNTTPLKNVDYSAIVEKSRKFRDIFEANVDNTNISFIVTEEEGDSNEFQAEIRYYKNGCLMQEMPFNVEIISRHDSIVVKWDRPSEFIPNISQYKIICDSTRRTTHSTDSSTNSTVITGLEPSCEYEVKLLSVSEYDLNLPNKLGIPIKTKPTSPPGKPYCFPIGGGIRMNLRWSKPLSIGSQCTITKYVVKEQQGTSDWQETVSVPPEDDFVLIKVNRYITYRFKVYCDCGIAGKSLDSEVSDDFIRTWMQDIFG